MPQGLMPYNQNYYKNGILFGINLQKYKPYAFEQYILLKKILMWYI